MNSGIFKTEKGKGRKGEKGIRSLALLCSFAPLLLCSLPASAATERITATIAITNAPTTNGMTITIAAGNTTVRTWTNSVTVPASHILTNSAATGSATNLYNQLIATAPLGVAPIVMSSPTNIILYGQSGVGLTVTLSAQNYGSVSYATQTVATAVNVRVPFSIETAAQRTNISSATTLIINDAANTNQLAQSAPAMAQLVGLTNAQTITGAKNFSSVTGQWKGIVSNSPAISGTVVLVTNGLFRTPILLDPTSTNGVNYGNAFSSPGTGSESEQFGLNANASGDNALAVGFTAEASASQATAIGGSSVAGLPNAIAIGQAATVASGYTGTNGVAIGQQAEVRHENSIAIGPSALTTAANQIRLGSTSSLVSIAGSVEHLKTTGTNSFSDIAFRAYSITSLANGNNAGIIIGTNTLVDVSGPSAAFTICGMTGSPSRHGHIVILENDTGFDMTIAHQSGTDPVAANRIISNTGADRTTTGAGTAIFRYNGPVSRWKLIAFDP